MNVFFLIGLLQLISGLLYWTFYQRQGSLGAFEWVFVARGIVCLLLGFVRGVSTARKLIVAFMLEGTSGLHVYFLAGRGSAIFDGRMLGFLVACIQFGWIYRDIRDHEVAKTGFFFRAYLKFILFWFGICGSILIFANAAYSAHLYKRILASSGSDPSTTDRTVLIEYITFLQHDLFWCTIGGVIFTACLIGLVSVSRGLRSGRKTGCEDG